MFTLHFATILISGRNELKLLLGGYLLMHFTECAFLVSPPVAESFFSFGQLSMAQG